MAFSTNIKFQKMCATCKYWDDPVQSVVRPTIGRNIWEIDIAQFRFCLKKKVKKKANATCQQHECKLVIL